jgi:hypothetical protein
VCIDLNGGSIVWAIPERCLVEVVFGVKCREGDEKRGVPSAGF